MNKQSTELLAQVTSTQIMRNPRSAITDSNKQHRIQIPLYTKDKEINPEVTGWLDDQAKSDIIGIDDIPKDRILQARYGNLKTRAERKVLHKIRQINATRPEAELRKDLSSNEPLQPLVNWQEWNKDKKKYDIDTVDTIPEHLGGYSANKIRQAVLPNVKRHKYNRGMALNTFGYYSPGFTPKKHTPRNYIRVNKLIKGSPSSFPTLAHETGHAVDFNIFGNLMKGGSLQLNKGDSVYEQMKASALEYKPISPNTPQSYQRYRHKSVELFADAFTAFTMDPRRTEQKYPAFYRYMAKRDRNIPIIAKKAKRDFISMFVSGLKRL
jgi:hypothetical protein